MKSFRQCLVVMVVERIEILSDGSTEEDRILRDDRDGGPGKSDEQERSATPKTRSFFVLPSPEVIKPNRSDVDAIHDDLATAAKEKEMVRKEASGRRRQHDEPERIGEAK